MSIVRKRYGITDGYINMPNNTTHYILGFVDITEVPELEIVNYRGKATFSAPLLEIDEGDEVFFTLTNLGLTARPDLEDIPIFHCYGFTKQIPLRDEAVKITQPTDTSQLSENSETSGSIETPPHDMPIIQDFNYYYKPIKPGTYTYSCNFKSINNIQMGMIGPVIVRPKLGKDYVYDHPRTKFDKEATILLSELDSRYHSLFEKIQEVNTMDYRPNYWLINGRSYPDTLKPDNDPTLPFQPHSSLVEAIQGEKVLLRFINLGFQQQSIQLIGATVTVIGQDASLLVGGNGENITFKTHIINISAGQTVDVLFKASQIGTIPIYNRKSHKNTVAGSMYGGMVTEVRVTKGGVT